MYTESKTYLRIGAIIYSLKSLHNFIHVILIIKRNWVIAMSRGASKRVLFKRSSNFVKISVLIKFLAVLHAVQE